MIIKIKVLKLKHMLKLISGAIKNRKKESILAYLLIKVIKNKIFCATINEEIEVVTYDIYENYFQDIEVVLKFEAIYKICKYAKEDLDIFIKKNKNFIEIKLENAYFTFPNTLSEKFPYFGNELEAINKFKISSINLYNLFSCLLVTLNENNIHDFLNGVYMEINENLITVFSSDGNRFTFAYDYIKHANKNFNIIIPKQTIIEIINLLHMCEEIYIVLTKNYIKFITYNVTLTSKLINDIYELPDIDLSQNLFIKTKLEKKNIKNALYKINFLTKENKITFEFNKNEMILFTYFNNEKGYVSIKIENFYINKFSISLNNKYLLDSLKYITNELFIFICSKKKNFIVIKEENKKYIYTMIPL